MSVIACIWPLMWSIFFIALMIFFFSLTILQGIVSEYSDRLDPDIVEPLKTYFGGFSTCFKTLFIVVVGDDWLGPHEHLSEMGFMYAMIMPLFVIFINIGVLNIMVGVFSGAAATWHDIDIVAQDAILDLEEFVECMLTTFNRIVPVGSSIMDPNTFRLFLQREEVQAYLSSHELDVGHASLIYKLCDLNGDGQVDIGEFVLGMMKHKGRAKMLDGKVMMHAVGAIVDDIQLLREELRQIRPKSVKRQTHPKSVELQEKGVQAIIKYVQEI